MCIRDRVYSRSSIKLGGPRVLNPPDKWVREENAFAGLVSPDLFFKVRKIFEANQQKLNLTNDHLLESLRAILRERGHLSGDLLKQLKQSPTPQTFKRRFGSILTAYRLVGFDPHRDCGHFEITRHLTQITRELMARIMVFPQKDTPGKYLILDGHLRWHALKELGHAEADCILARDDECFTYNARVSRITPIQEHRMIVKAVNQGVPPERIAAALNIPVRVVKAFMNLLLNIHEVVADDLLKDKNISPRTLRLSRRVNGVRQIEIAELMVGAENYTKGHVEALILDTPKDQLAKPVATKKRKGFSPENIARMEQEMAMLERELKAVEAGYGENVLNLTLARSYIRKLLDNPAVTKFLTAHHADIFGEFKVIATAETL